jgi:hypothetical protein
LASLNCLHRLDWPLLIHWEIKWRKQGKDRKDPDGKKDFEIGNSVRPFANLGDLLGQAGRTIADFRRRSPRDEQLGRFPLSNGFDDPALNH